MREKTDSITHLVKIVAKEVFNNKSENINFKFNQLVDRVSRLETQLLKHETSEKIILEMERAGECWTEQEDAMLRAELKIAMTVIAKTHDRSYGAITSRIGQKGLI